MRTAESLGLLNSAGTRIHPDDAGIENFWRWFRGSKVVDFAGRPLVVYHGTCNDFCEFRAGKSGANTQAAWSHMGSFFTPDARLASDFTKGKNWSKKGASPKQGGCVLPVYLAIKNPMYLPASRALPLSGSVEDVRKLREVAEADGHDGIVIEAFRKSFGFDDPTGELLQPQYIAFRAEQIKSAIGNDGTFDPNDHRIAGFEGPERILYAIASIVANSPSANPAEMTPSRRRLRFG